VSQFIFLFFCAFEKKIMEMIYRLVADFYENLEKIWKI